MLSGVKTLGMIGGTGPESTIEYYRRLIAGYRARNVEGRLPAMVINSVDNKKLVDLFTANELAQVADYLTEDRTTRSCGGRFRVDRCEHSTPRVR